MLRHWDMVDADLHAEFGIDTWDQQVMQSRPWPWLRARILQLPASDTRITRWARARYDRENPRKGNLRKGA